MVKICSIKEYPKENEVKYKEYFDKYKYPLYTFQKWAIEGIIEGNHVLITAPTGSGKTMPGEFAIDYFTSIGKKVIYCSPIKALSNQKYYDFTHKYPNISIGLITGDIKTNSDAKVLIMTTEILLNKLYQIKQSCNNNFNSSSVSFDMDIHSELGCVIFDEIHMINDADRGHVWENSIVFLPHHIQIIGLSATLDNPEQFAKWIETKDTADSSDSSDILNNSNNSNKIVYLSMKKERAVPLTHYSFITVTSGIFKTIKDKSVQEEIKGAINKLVVVQDSKGNFNDTNYLKITKMLNIFETQNIRLKRSFVLNQVSQHLVQNEMLPALCYVFSRKQVEICAKEITTNLLEFDSKVPYTINRECEQIIRKLPNYDEYLHLPEYINLVSLLEKGVAIHHSGMIPILREIVEILFAKGRIKLLFCTESVAIGLNLPVKTTIFTDINKHDGTTFRTLMGHEFVQASGRAGRLGLDIVGHVVHLNNLFKKVETAKYKIMLRGHPQVLTSKFKFSYNLILNLIGIGNFKFMHYAEKSMIMNEINKEIKEVSTHIGWLSEELNNLQLYVSRSKTPIDSIKEYLALKEKKEYANNKKIKEVDRHLKCMIDQFNNLEKDTLLYLQLLDKQDEINKLQQHYDKTTNFIKYGVDRILNLLQNENFITMSDVQITEQQIVSPYSLTNYGFISMHLREIHCLVFAKLIHNKIITNLSAIQLVSFLSCFTNVSVSEEIKDIYPKCEDYQVQDIILKTTEMYLEYKDKELRCDINSEIDYNMHYDLVNYVKEWGLCENVEECKHVLQKLGLEKGIFLGEFVKALLKINNISNELEKVSELIGNIEFLHKLKDIPNITLKYVVTAQSLYV